jgi:phosphoribosylformylglycinamidine synthase
MSGITIRGIDRNNQYLVSPGEQCFTPSEAEKLRDRINKLGGAKVHEVRGINFYYTHLNPESDQTAIRVSQVTRDFTE